MQHWIELIQTKDALYFSGAALLLLIVLTAKRWIWFLFRFDDNVAQILHEKKSSEVRVGKVVESIAPFLDDFPVDVRKPGTSTNFLGQPIDFIHFDPEEGVSFIEVKSGNAALSPTQRKIKRLIEEGKVRWIEYRVK